MAYCCISTYRAWLCQEETDAEVLVEIGAGVVWGRRQRTVSNGWGREFVVYAGEVGQAAIQKR